MAGRAEQIPRAARLVRLERTRRARATRAQVGERAVGRARLARAVACRATGEAGSLPASRPSPRLRSVKAAAAAANAGPFMRERLPVDRELGNCAAGRLVAAAALQGGLRPLRTRAAVYDREGRLRPPLPRLH